jgi:hypothetical protein
MKKSLIGYVEPKKIIEVVAAVEPKKLEEFFDSIKEHNFEEGYVLPSLEEADNANNGDLKAAEVKESSFFRLKTYNKLQTSDDIINALKSLSEQCVVDFEPFTELLESDSKLNNPIVMCFMAFPRFQIKIKT